MELEKRITKYFMLFCAEGFFTRECAGRKLNFFSEDKKSWDDARKTCLRYKSVLASMKNQADKECMMKASQETGVNFWIGGKRENPDEDCKDNANDANPCRHDAWEGYCKDFYWLQPREKIKKEFWAVSDGKPTDDGEEPDNLNCGEDCVEVNNYQNGANDLNCTDLNGYICNAASTQSTSNPRPSGATGETQTPIGTVDDCDAASPLYTFHHFYSAFFISFSLLVFHHSRCCLK